MKEPLPLDELSDEQRVAYFGALFAMAAADETMDKEEVALILETLDTEGLNEEALRRVRSYVVEPPAMEEALPPLKGAPEGVRYGLLLQLVEVALANDLIEEAERHRLVEAQRALGVSDEQFAAMHKFAEEAKRIRERGIDDAYAADTLKAAAAGLAATGVPIAAIVYSGSVVGLSAAGITSGLAALGLGLWHGRRDRRRDHHRGRDLHRYYAAPRCGREAEEGAAAAGAGAEGAARHPKPPGHDRPPR